jgi:hypothetical protein
MLNDNQAFERDGTIVQSVEVDFAEHCDSLHDALRDLARLTADQAALILDWHRARIEHEGRWQTAQALRRFASFFSRDRNPAVQGLAMAMAFQLDGWLDDGSMSDAAERLGVTKAYISKAVDEWREAFDLPRSSYQKPQATVQSYRQSATTNHWRNQKCNSQHPKKIKLRSFAFKASD